MKKTTLMVPLRALVLLVPVGMALAQNTNGDLEEKDTAGIESGNGTYHAQVDELTMEGFKEEIRELLNEKDSEDYVVKADTIRAKYDQMFEIVIEQVRIDVGEDALTDNEVKGAKNYIFYETIKDEKIKALERSNTPENIGVDHLAWIGVQTASATCPKTTEPVFKQVELDIDGGKVGLFSFNGNNDLYDVSRYKDAETCTTTFVLSFYDEDHPFLDAFYDRYRSVVFGRTHDVESFDIEHNRLLVFDNTWSSSNDYACVIDRKLCHATTAKTYEPGQTIYVSNTWNHMMDTLDTNRSMSKVTVP